MTATLKFPRTHSRAYILYPHAQWYFFLAMATTWLGFSHTYFAVIRTEPIVHHIHGMVLGGWIALLILQPILYQRGQLTLHRRLGRLGVYVLVPAIVVTGGLMVRRMVQIHSLPPALVDHLAFMDMCALVLFPTFVMLSIVYARWIDLHARFMVCTVLLLMPPATTRALFILPFMRSYQRNINASMLLIDLVLLLLIYYDYRKGRVWAPYPIALVTNTVVGIGGNLAAGSILWQGLRSWVEAH